MGPNRTQWSRATEEIKIYDNQLEQLTQTPIFKEIVSGRAPKILNPKVQLFYMPKERRRRNVSSRTIKK